MRRFCRNFVLLWVNLMLWSEVYLFKACDKGMAVGGPPLSVESRLIRRLQRGDLAALGELYELFKDNVYRTALAITRDEHAAEDILQECFVRLYHYAASIDTERPLKPWLPSLSASGSSASAGFVVVTNRQPRRQRFISSS